jgi:hypothetical protein
MRFLVYSEVSAARIEASLGLPDYSYYFVLKEFLPLLRSLGEVTIVEQVEEVDALYFQAREEGEDCVFLSFTPPHKTPLDLQCPTIPVFAWEFDSIPNQHWLEDERQNWATVLQHCKRAITHSGLTVQAARAELGEDFPIASIPAPVWDKFAPLRDRTAESTREPVTLVVRNGVVIDTHDLSLAPYIPDADAVARAVASARSEGKAPIVEAASQGETLTPPRQSLPRITLRYLVEWYRLAWRLPRPLVAPVQPSVAPMEPPNPVEPGGLPGIEVDDDAMPPLPLGEHRLTLSGVVFTTVFNPYDGRKNWVDMLTAFCSAFRETPEATLLFKLGHHEYESAMNDMLMCMARMPAFKCRVILLHGYLDRPAFDELIRHTAYIVNASHGEGQCLPLMEFLSCGKPAVTPRHSAMVDYVDEDVAFLVDTWLDATAWPHDPRLAYRTLRHQIDWASLVRAYREAFHCFTRQPERYESMSHAAVERMRGHCSLEAGRERLLAFLAAGAA